MVYCLVVHLHHSNFVQAQKSKSLFKVTVCFIQSSEAMASETVRQWERKSSNETKLENITPSE